MLALLSERQTTATVKLINHARDEEGFRDYIAERMNDREGWGVGE